MYIFSVNTINISKYSLDNYRPPTFLIYHFQVYVFMANKFSYKLLTTTVGKTGKTSTTQFHICFTLSNFEVGEPSLFPESLPLVKGEIFDFTFPKNGNNKDVQKGGN